MFSDIMAALKSPYNYKKYETDLTPKKHCPFSGTAKQQHADMKCHMLLRGCSRHLAYKVTSGNQTSSLSPSSYMTVNQQPIYIESSSVITKLGIEFSIVLSDQARVQ